LRSKIAARSAQWGARFGADDLIITAGATQALRLALRAVCQPGDVVAIEQPAYFGTLLLLEDLGLKALEIPTDPVEGLLLEPLADAIRCHRPPPFWPRPPCKTRWAPVCPSRASRNWLPCLKAQVFL
jgi:DNA-binding transcriptional MocR family regulator